MLIGLNHDEYWDILPVDYQKYLNLYEQRERGKSKEIDALNWILGSYISYAFNNPKKYPDKPYLYEEDTKGSKVMTSKEMDQVMKRNTLRLGGTIK